MLLATALLLVAALASAPPASAQGSGSTYSDEVTADAPRGYWQLGESFGATASDQMGNHPGAYELGPTLGQPGAIAGSQNTAVRFHSGGDQLRVPNAAGLNSASAFSIEAWIKPAQLPSYTATLARKSGQYLLRLRYDGALSLYIGSSGSSGPELRTAKGLVSAGAWQHIVVTDNGSQLTIWLDGVSRGSRSVSGPLDISTSDLLFASSGGYDAFDGTLDELAVYTTALSPERISAHFSAATSPPPPDTTPPAVTLTEPAQGSSSADPLPTFSGAAGNDAGDDQQVTVKVYSGSAATGTPVQTLNTNRSAGSWSVAATNALADGTYTAQAEQSDAAANVGLSGTRTFSIAQPPPSTYSDEVMADAPRGYWRLGESSGTVAADQTGNHPGVYELGPTLGQPGAIAGSQNTAARFHSTGDQLRVPNAAGLNSASAFSIEAWIKPAQLPSYTATLARKSGQYLLRLRYDGALSVFSGSGGSSGNELRTAKGLVSAGDWQHIVVTNDGSKLEIWLDGVKRGSRTVTGPLDVSSSALYFASSRGYDWFDGTLDELALYTTALSPERISAHFERANQFDETPPAVTLKTPTAGSTMDAATNFGGKAGTTSGDQSAVSLRVWAGPQASGNTVVVLNTIRRSSGSFSVLADPPLPSGTYTARAEQSDESGNLGLSNAVTFTVNASAAPSLLAAGDVGYCSSPGDEATADVLDSLGGSVAMLGDAAYESGTATEFANCYDPSWGRHLARTRAIPGDHDYDTPNAAAYFDYFGAAAGDPSKGYYSYELGDWHVVALNSVCYEDGSCEIPLENWLEADLEANQSSCTVALLHEPLFSSGDIHGNNDGVKWLWHLMYNADVDVVLSGSEHIYERFAKQTPNGVADPQRGIREFIVGTGGRGHYGIGTVQPNSEVRNTDTFGILKMTLNTDSYDWEFLPEAGKSFTDTGSTTCH